ncbi:MAG: major capsid protein [Microviridae sp.]|nr:MAG: major capsid protein [Microviridae sp.]
MAQIKTRHATNPLAVPRTRRKHDVRNMTSLPAGKVVPVATIPLLREDSMRGRFAFAFEMQQTVEVLLNGIDVVCEAWLVPNLAMPEFRTADDLDLAYTGRKRDGEAAPTPYFVTQPAGAPETNQIHQRLGKHRRATQSANMSYVRAYNAAVNFARSEVSANIPQRDLLDKTLAQAMWPKNMFSHIVPDFDQAVMQGEVALTVAQQNLTLKGPANARYVDVTNPTTAPLTTLSSGAGGGTPTPIKTVDRAGNHVAYAGLGDIRQITGLKADLQGAVAVLQDNGITISLANIETARKAQIFANIMKRYNAHEDMIRDLLMDGISVTEQAWRQPILLKRGDTRFGMSKRYSSDADAMTTSIVDGAAAIEFNLNVPRVPGGGVVIILAYCAPEQLFERMEDPYLAALSPDDLPAFLEDHLDPEAVQIVKNDYIDNDHDQPDDIYGYGPKNFPWNFVPPGIGGRFHRPEVDAGFDEDRNAIWAVETQNPRLTKDAYLVPADIHLKPFWTSTIDPFDCITLGQCVIEGNTQFGPALIEALPVSEYDVIMSKVDLERIDKEPVPA